MTTRTAGAKDEPFLLALFESTLDTAAIPETLREALVRMQYNARQVSYGRQFPFSDQVLILVHEKRAGALRVLRDTNEIRLIDIALLPEFRGVGIGTRLLGALIDEAATACKPLRLSVARTNVDAIRLYRRLGFKSAGEDGLHLQMELSP